MIFRLIAIVAVLTASCGPETTSETKFTQGTIRGHEILTYWGIEKANEDIVSSLGETARSFEPISDKESANTSDKMIVRGNFATDFAAKVPEYSLHEFYGVDSSVDMTNEGPYQDQHFLRNYKAKVTINDEGDEEIVVEWVEEAKDACEATKTRIVNATSEAVKSWDEDKQRGLFFLGHALHMVQDSFATVHAKRSEDFKTIKDICIYNLNVPDVCKHPYFSGADKVFKSGWHCFAHKEDWECLKPEAKMASEVTAGYLYSVARHLSGRSTGEEPDIEKDLNDFFHDENQSPRGSGYFSCEGL